MEINSQELAALEKRCRAALVNSLSGFKSANLVGTVSPDGVTNVAIMSSAVHLGSHPPLLALVVRPGGDERHTLANILATGSYTLNHVTTSIVEESHQTAARYPAEESEFDAAGLTPLWRDGLTAPMVQESAIRLGLELREHQELTINGTHLVIGEVVHIDIPDQSLRDDGGVDLVAADSVALVGLDTYCAAQTIKRMAYAKPDLPPRVLPHTTAG